MIGVRELAGEPEISTRRTWLGHPVGLVNLFGVELWERFSFYGMLTILGYYPVSYTHLTLPTTPYV